VSHIYYPPDKRSCPQLSSQHHILHAEIRQAFASSSTPLPSPTSYFLTHKLLPSPTSRFHLTHAPTLSYMPLPSHMPHALSHNAPCPLTQAPFLQPFRIWTNEGKLGSTPDNPNLIRSITRHKQPTTQPSSAKHNVHRSEAAIGACGCICIPLFVPCQPRSSLEMTTKMSKSYRSGMHVKEGKMEGYTP
jgi:hypothetical protein